MFLLVPTIFLSKDIECSIKQERIWKYKNEEIWDYENRCWLCNRCLYSYFSFPVRLTALVSVFMLLPLSSLTHSLVHQRIRNSVQPQIRWLLLYTTHTSEKERIQDYNVWIWEKRKKTRNIINYVANREHTWAERVPWSKRLICSV